MTCQKIRTQRLTCKLRRENPLKDLICRQKKKTIYLKVMRTPLYLCCCLKVLDVSVSMYLHVLSVAVTAGPSVPSCS